MTALPRHLLPQTAGIDDTGRLHVGGCDVLDLAERHGTPLFVYDEEHLRARCREALDAFGPGGATYASKAFLCKAMAQLVHEEGLGIDVATGGELHVALAAGTPPSEITLHGNNKSVDELRMALEVGVGHLVVDSEEEVARIEALVAEGLPRPTVLVRVTPGVHAHTHEYVMTGQEDTKFGFSLESGAAARIVERLQGSGAVDLAGIHAHIGSNIFLLSGFEKAVERLAPFVNGLDLPELVLGGGLGVAYVEGEETPSIDEWAGVLQRSLKEHGVTARLGVEPGRAIVAGAAVTLYRVGTIKRLPGIRTYVAVDGGMSDNPRPVLYGSGYETFLPRATTADRPLDATVVGKHCESGDVIVREARLPDDLRVGDVLATPVTGAYGHSMASTYNKVTRPPVLFVRDGEERVVVRRETYDDLLRLDL
jgi:diaminopimelate decarboxylase